MKTLILFATLLTITASGQDPVFSQFFANPLYMSPALSGTSESTRLALNHRNQWPDFDNAFVTSAVSVDTYLPRFSSGIGIVVMNDMVANKALSTNSASLNYAYHFRTGKSTYLSAGLRGTLYQRKVDWSSLTWGDMIDDSRGFIYQTSQPMNGPSYFVDFSTGLTFKTKDWCLGGSVDHITQPDEGLLSGDSPMAPKYSFFASRKFMIQPNGLAHNKYSIRPMVIAVKQAALSQINMGVQFTWSSITLGGMYRVGESIIVLAGLRNENYQVGYSYDFAAGGLFGSTLGSHELSIQYFIQKKIKKSYPMLPLECPSF